MNGYPVFWNQTNHQKSAERIGEGLPAPGGLIQKIYEVDPLTCPKCCGKMKVISLIEEQDVIKKILKHLGLWEVKPRPRMAKTQPLHTEPRIDYSDSQDVPSDNILYHLAFIQNSRYVFRVEERIALPSSLSGASFRLELVRLPSLHYAPGFHFDTASIALRGDFADLGSLLLLIFLWGRNKPTRYPKGEV